MLSMPLNDYRFSPYYLPNLQFINIYQKIAYMNNNQSMNVYSNPMEYYEEESHMNQKIKQKIYLPQAKIALIQKTHKVQRIKHTYIFYLIQSLIFLKKAKS